MNLFTDSGRNEMAVLCVNCTHTCTSTVVAGFIIIYWVATPIGVDSAACMALYDLQNAMLWSRALHACDYRLLLTRQTTNIFPFGISFLQSSTNPHCSATSVIDLIVRRPKLACVAFMYVLSNCSASGGPTVAL
jgi:hypothetical protein